MFEIIFGVLSNLRFYAGAYKWKNFIFLTFSPEKISLNFSYVYYFFSNQNNIFVNYLILILNTPPYFPSKNTPESCRTRALYLQ